MAGLRKWLGTCGVVPERDNGYMERNGNEDGDK